MRKFILLLFCFLGSTAQAQEFKLADGIVVNYKGSVGFAAWRFPATPPRPTLPGDVYTARGHLDLTLQLDAPLQFRINQRFQFDSDDSNRNRYEFDDLYLDYFRDSFELRVGYQIFSWKTVESISHADFLNQVDLESDFLDPEKRAELALRLRFIPDTDVEQVFEIYYFAKMRPTRFPVGNNRFTFGLPIHNDPARHTWQSDAAAWRPQIALSYQRPFFENIDARLFYFNGYNRYPGLVPPAEPGKAFSQHYRLVQKGGLALQGELGSWLVKGEFVYTAYNRSLVNQRGQTIRPRYLAHTFGVEYTLYAPFFENQDIGIILERIGDSDAGTSAEELESFRPFQNHIFAGMRYAFNNASDRSLLLGAFLNERARDYMLRFEYEDRLFERLKLKMTWFNVTAETSPLDGFDHTDRFILELAYNF